MILPVNPMAILGWQRYVVYLLVILFFATTCAGFGYHYGVKQLWDYQAEQAKAAVVIVTKRGKVTQRIVTKYVKVKEDSGKVAEEVRKGVEDYAKTNGGACLDDAWRRLHDAAATNSLSRSPRGADEALRTSPAYSRSEGDDSLQRARYDYLKLRASPRLRGFGG